MMSSLAGVVLSVEECGVVLQPDLLYNVYDEAGGDTS